MRVPIVIRIGALVDDAPTRLSLINTASQKMPRANVLDPKLESWAASYLYSIAGAEDRYNGKAKSVSGIKAADDMTLEVTLATPDVTFLYALTQPFMAPVPQKAVEQMGDDFAKRPVGNGPFKVTNYDSQGQSISFARHDGYFHLY